MQYARTKSDVHAQRDGDYDTHLEERLKRKGIEEKHNLNSTRIDAYAIFVYRGTQAYAFARSSQTYIQRRQR